MTTAQRLMTAEELATLPDDGRRYRLVRGELIAMSPGNKRHGRYAMRLSGPLAMWVYEHDLGEVYAAETGFQLGAGPDTVQAAELAYATRERADAADEAPGPWWPGAPDLAAEVMSPSIARRRSPPRWRTGLRPARASYWCLPPVRAR